MPHLQRAVVNGMWLTEMQKTSDRSMSVPIQFTYTIPPILGTTVGKKEETVQKGRGLQKASPRLDTTTVVINSHRLELLALGLYNTSPIKSHQWKGRGLTRLYVLPPNCWLLRDVRRREIIVFSFILSPEPSRLHQVTPSCVDGSRYSW